MHEINKKYLCKHSYNNIKKDNHYIISIKSPRNLIYVIDNITKQLEIFSFEYNFYPMFYNYFYTEQEERKLKLERLNHVGSK